MGVKYDLVESWYAKNVDRGFLFPSFFIDLNVSMYSIRMIYGKDFKDIPNN